MRAQQAELGDRRGQRRCPASGSRGGAGPARSRVGSPEAAACAAARHGRRAAPRRARGPAARRRGRACARSRPRRGRAARRWRHGRARPETTMMGVSLTSRMRRQTVAPSMPGHGQVEQHEVGLVVAEAAQRLLAVVGGDDAMAGLAEQRAEGADHGRLVVHDEDLERLGPSRRPRAPCRGSSSPGPCVTGAPGAQRLEPSPASAQAASSAKRTRMVLSPARVPSCSCERRVVDGLGDGPGRPGLRQ